MPSRKRGNGGGNWQRALVLSFALHAVGLLAVGLTISQRPSLAEGRALPLAPFPVDDITTVVDLAAADVVLPPDLVPLEAAVILDQALGGPWADRSNPVAPPASHPTDGLVDRRAPAPDRGTGPGRLLADPAWRRDASTLHERLADGADVNQPSRARTAARTASPQAVRREARTGIADSVRNERPTQALPAPFYGVQDPNDEGWGGETVETEGRSDNAAPSPTLPVTADRTVENATQGPLDADRGTRSYDVNHRGAKPLDDRAARAASRESEPSITDLTLAAVSGNGSEGRGPSDKSGAVAHASPGTAAAPAGVRSPTDGQTEEQRTQERMYDRYRQEIRERVQRALIFPRKLAVRLEQGETILRFVVRPDGNLGDTPQVTKSSGFSEFDQAALDAVRRASPFPPLPVKAGRAGPLSVAPRVTFSNPVIR